MVADPKLKLLVADDDEDLQRAIKRVAEAAGYEVLQEFDGRLVVPMARANRPALILLDISMPGSDGRDVLQRLKEDQETTDIPVLIHSVRTEPYERRMGLELGADDYVDKPCAPALLLLRISRMIENSKHGNAAR